MISEIVNTNKNCFINSVKLNWRRVWKKLIAKLQHNLNYLILITKLVTRNKKSEIKKKHLHHVEVRRSFIGRR